MSRSTTVFKKTKFPLRASVYYTLYRASFIDQDIQLNEDKSYISWRKSIDTAFHFHLDHVTTAAYGLDDSETIVAFNYKKGIGKAGCVCPLLMNVAETARPIWKWTDTRVCMGYLPHPRCIALHSQENLHVYIRLIQQISIPLSKLHRGAISLDRTEGHTNLSW